MNRHGWSPDIQPVSLLHSDRRLLYRQFTFTLKFGTEIRGQQNAPHICVER